MRFLFFIKWIIGPANLALAALWFAMALRAPLGRPFSAADLFGARSLEQRSRAQLIVEAILFTIIGVVVTIWFPTHPYGWMGLPAGH